MRNQQLLLVEDVDDLGRSGDIVTVKPGYARNFLLPKRKGVIASEHTLRMQAKLKEERAKRAESDKKEAEDARQKLDGKLLEITVKVDPDGHMYGSVGYSDIIRLFEQEGIHLEKRNVVLTQPIRELGEHQLIVKLKEGVTFNYTLRVNSDIPLPSHAKSAPAPAEVEEPK